MTAAERDWTVSTVTISSMPQPDSVFIQFESTSGFHQATRQGDRWTRAGAELEWTQSGLALTALRPVSRIALRWRSGVPSGAQIFGDAWERTYGDVAWGSIIPHRLLPWLWLAHDPATRRTIGAGVKTSPTAWCSWTVDVDGITLWADVRSGQRPVTLGGRRLEVASMVAVSSRDGALEALHELTAALAPTTPLRTGPIVGSNNWYYAYGFGFDADAVVADARLIVELAAGHSVAPFGVIDAGWGIGTTSSDGGPWTAGKDSFSAMGDVADRIAAEGARPGLWYRPLLSREQSSHTHSVFTDVGFPIDPSIPGALEAIANDIQRFRGWGFELIKHDFSTFDITGAFAPQFGTSMGTTAYTFADQSRTTGEITMDVYRTIAAAAGDATVIGCNTVGHWSAGLVTASRIGDDTSGKQWERTRRMGVNTLAARLPQHGRFFTADPDCVPATAKTSWKLNRQFMDLVAQSGAALFLSLDPRAVDDEVLSDASSAVRTALDGGAPGGARPIDFLESTTPRRWLIGAREVEYDWSGPIGAEPWIHGI